MTKFSDLKLDSKVLKAIAEAGYESPTPIQEGAIPPALEGRDVLGIAQTGTGKTASFTLPMITRLSRGRARARMPRSLVLCPTRELAAQVAENFDIYAKHTRLTKALLIGGVSFGEQDKLIDRGVDVLIATPGRLLDHFERGKLLLTGVEVMVVDEADRMLDMGFIPDIERIFQLTPFTRQTLFFSATMAPEIERITNTFLHTPERVEIARQATTSETITQKLVEITPTRKDQTAKQKRELLRALINAEGDDLKNAIIFCNRKTEVDIVAKSLKAHGLDGAPIHGDLDQTQRMRTLEAFRDGALRFLVASDVAARGLDIPAVSHVFNFDLPSHAEDYVHRIGRTGRAGRQGTAYSIATPADEKYLTAIEQLVKQTLPRAESPEDFALSDAARAAPRTTRDNGRNSSRSRSRSRRNDDRREDTASWNEPERDQANIPSRNENRGERRSDRRQGDRDSGRRVAGMGDHIPEFLKHSFADALAATEAVIERNAAEEAARATNKRTSPEKAAEESPDTDITEPTAGMTVVEPTAPDTADASKPPARKATRSRSRSPKKAKTETAAVAEPQPEDSVMTDEAAPEKPKKVTRRRSPRKSTAAKPEDAAELPTTNEAQPETRQPGSAGSETPEADPEAPPAKPKRRTTTRSRKIAAKPAPSTTDDQDTIQED
ncbi:MAG: DEAD/DEAH box helicase [Paracoccus sp. (in: a-proteobacteria)]